ncbi:hypothetical protein L195_g004657, partial [Trifolium pratense]
AGQPELIALEKALKEAMVPAGKARESDFGREVPLFEVEATAVEPVFQKLYSYIFDMDSVGSSVTEMDKPVPSAIFIVNFDKVRLDPRNKEIDLDSLMYGKIPELTEEDMKKQEGDYIYRYRYDGGGATQVWLSSGRFVVIDLSAGPCTYGKIEAEEGSVSSRTLPRLRNVVSLSSTAFYRSSNDIFLGQLASLVSTTVEHVIAPDVRVRHFIIVFLFMGLQWTERILTPDEVLQQKREKEQGQAGSLVMPGPFFHFNCLVPTFLSNIGHGGFLENRYGHFVNDGGATAPYSDMEAPLYRPVCWIFGSPPWSAIDNIVADSSPFFMHTVLTFKAYVFETVDLTSRLLIPIIVLQNHNRYNILQKGHNYSINIDEIKTEVKKLLHDGQEVVIIGGTHSLHRHEKLSIAVSKAMRGHSLQETKNDGRFHVHTKTYLDGAILKEEMERSADVLAAGLLEVADPSLSSKYFLRQSWMEESEGPTDSILKHKPLWSSYNSKQGKKKRKNVKKQGDLQPTYGTRVVPVFVLSLADVDPNLMMEDESMVWTSNDVVIVLEHQNEKIPLSYVSETQRRHAVPSQAQRHILAGIATVVGGLSAPYAKVSHVHERPIVNWLWAAGCHPFGPFSNTSHVSQMLLDVALRNSIYARVDSVLRKIRETSETVQGFAAEYLKTPLGEPVKGKKEKSTTELWLEKFYKKTTNLPEPFPHELVDRLEKYLDGLEELLVDMSSLLYDHRLKDAFLNSSDILQSTMFTQQYVDHVLTSERDNMKCCKIEYKYPVHSSQTYIYGGILIAGFIVYFVVIFFSSPVR